MESDLRTLVKEANEVGDTAVVMILQILDELDIELKEIQ